MITRIQGINFASYSNNSVKNRDVEKQNALRIRN